MKLMHFFILCFLMLILFPVTSFSQDEKKINKIDYKLDYNLNGVFSGAGGKYYLRQLGDEVLWYGEEDAVSPTWSNVAHGIIKGNKICLLYTSDAADERSSVDLGGRRIIKKKKTTKRGRHSILIKKKIKTKNTHDAE